MLPEIPQREYLYKVPKFEMDRGDVHAMARELKEFHEIFADCFRRSESRENFYLYMSGRFTQLERKTIEPVAIAMKGGKVRAMQRFVSDAPWDDEKILHKYHDLINEDLGHPDGALIFDESGFVKKGADSVGVARQYCGTVGKVENCQVGVFAAYASKHGYALIDKRLYIPEQWFSDAYKKRREKCNLPGDMQFKTKPRLAAEMLNNIAEKKQIPFRYVLGDPVYGANADFVETVESLGVTYLLQIPGDTLCWLKHPDTTIKTYMYKGKKKTKKVLADLDKVPVSVKMLAAGINDFFWYKRKVSQGAKGPVEYEFTRKKIILSSGGMPERAVWLLIRRTIGKKVRYSYFISNAPDSTRLPELVWLSGLRWSVEQCFEETKTELGMDQYEVRKFPGWHHHILTCMLGHYFLWHLKIRLGKKSTCYYAPTA